MAFLTLANWKTNTGTTSTDATRDAAITAMLAQVEDAIKKRLHQPVESATYTEYYDAPVGPLLALRWLPVSSVTSIHYHPGANGDPAAFVAGDALTQYEQWVLEADQADGTSRCGLVRRVGAAGWGMNYRRPAGRLAPNLEPGRKSLKVVYTAGYSSVPASILAAGYLMTSRLYESRQRGFPVNSESLNSYSYSASNATADSLLDMPDIHALLLPFKTVSVGVA